MTGFVLRAPWYVRERAEIDVLDPRAARPELQMYDGTDFVKRLMADPRDSLKFTDDDLWSYPVPVSLAQQKLRYPDPDRHWLATHQLVTSSMRKLYQPSHNRFYVVVVEVLCDQPGLPRAGSHDDFTVGFVMRRHHTSITGARRPTRQLARNLMRELAGRQGVPHDGSEPPEDVRDLWWAENPVSDEVQRFEQFEQQNRDLIDQLHIRHQHQGWIAPTGALAGWQDVEGPEPAPGEQVFSMWRLPRREGDCEAATTRSTWFGIVPTFSAEHATVDGNPVPKLDEHAVYEVRCFVSVPPGPGHKHCPPVICPGHASRPFRLAAPMDPQGTSKRTTSITLPDLRRLAARAGEPPGPGGVKITTPPNSQLSFNPLTGKLPQGGAGAIGPGGGVCTFALELFFIVAFFLFLMFLPIVVFAFQLWWMLALRFCIPPSGAVKIVKDFFAAGHLLAEVEVNATVRSAFDLQFGTDSKLLEDPSGGWAEQMSLAVHHGGAHIFTGHEDLVVAALTGAEPPAVPQPPPARESKPPDPLCDGPDA